MGLERRQQQLAEVWKHGGRKGVQGLGGRVSRGQRLRDEAHQAVLRLLYASQAETR